MTLRWFRCLALVLMLLGLAMPASPLLATVQRQPDRIVAVGDLHGDFAAWTAIARDAGLIDAAGHWAGGRTTLVQLGDIADRGPDTLRIIRSLQLLQREARVAGGQVIVVLGNHEAMNLLGDLRYVTAAEYNAFVTPASPGRRDDYWTANRRSILADYLARDGKLGEDVIRRDWLTKTPLGWVEHGLAWSPQGEFGRWASSNPAIVRIGRYLFAHGGISAETAALSIARVNRTIAKAMANRQDGPQSPLNDPLGPLWYRGNLGRDADAEAVRAPERRAMGPEAELNAVLSAYGAQHLVIGHTPQPKGILFRYGGKLAVIDTAISRYYGGTLSWLEIAGDKMTPHIVKRPPK